MVVRRQPSDEAKRQVEEILEQNNWWVDMVLSHTCSYKYIPTETFKGHYKNVDTSTEPLLDTIEERLHSNCWYCGHYHINFVCGKLEILYDNVVTYGGYT